MKARKLIDAIVAAADGDLDTEVCVGNVDIYFVSREPAWYDGPLEVLWRDPSKEPFYNIVGAEIRKEGWKIQLHEHSIGEMLLDNPEFPVKVSSEREHEMIERQRQEMRKLQAEVDEWIAKRREVYGRKLRQWPEEVDDE